MDKFIFTRRTVMRNWVIPIAVGVVAAALLVIGMYHALMWAGGA